MRCEHKQCLKKGQQIKSSVFYIKTLFRLFAKTLCGLSILVGLLACTGMEGYRDSNPDPDDRLDDMLILFEYQNSQHNECLDIERPPSAIGDCARIVVEMERILNDFPTHERTMMTLSILYYQMNRIDRAQYMLDQLLNIPGTKPEAAILRAMIALKDGNVTLAARVLTRQILLAPESEELRSALASVYYSQGETHRARTVLNMSNQTNENQWLLSYHNGLLAETEKDWLAACKLYANALRVQPNFGPARSRIIALTEFISCSDSESVAAFISTPIVKPYSVKKTEIVPYAEPIQASVPLAVESQISIPQIVKPEFTLQQLIGINTERLDQENVIANFTTTGAFSDVLMIHMNEPPRVILQIPNAISSLVSANNILNDKLLDSMSILSEGDNISITILMRGSATIKMTNGNGLLQLHFNESIESFTKP